MHMRRYLAIALSGLASLFLAAVPPLFGQEEEAAEATSPWTDVAEVSYVATGGNAEAETLSLRNTLAREWERAQFTLEAVALRAENTTLDPIAVGAPGSFSVDERSRTELTAERYLLRGRYERSLTERRFWFAGGGWERNEFAGIANRFFAQGGVGNVWFDDDVSHFKTDYALTFTDQENVVGGSESFAGVRFAWDYLRQLTPTTEYANLLILDGNADETSDYRADMINSIAVAMSDRLALKVSLQLFYDNLPSLRAVPLVGADGVPTGETVNISLDELDSVFNVALVVNF